MRIVLLYVLLPLILFILSFYFWGQAASKKNNQLHLVETFPGQSFQERDTFSIMTYNLGYLSGMTNNLPVKPAEHLFETNLEKARNLINKWRPDIIGFQEIDFRSRRSYYMNQADSLAEGYTVIVKSVNWDKKYVPFPYWPPGVHFGRMLSGQALFSKFPLLNSERMVLSGPRTAPFYYRAFYLDRLIQTAQLSVHGREVLVLNVHLEAFDKETREIQATEVLQFVDQYVQQQPLILIGDFNARPPYASEIIDQEQTISMFLDHPALSPAINRQAYLAHEQQNFTYHSRDPFEKLDYIFYTHQYIQPVTATTVREAGEISDHLPVFMTFTFQDK